MQRHTVTVPLSMMRQIRVSWDIDWRGQGLGETNSGNSQVVYNAFPRWVGEPELLFGRALLGQWRAIRWQAQGRLGMFRIPMFDPAVMNVRALAASAAVEDNGIPFANGQFFSSGSGFEFSPFCEVLEDAPAGAEVLRVRMPGADYQPQIGQIMSHQDWPFGVTSVMPSGGGDYELGVQRFTTAAAAGEMIPFLGVGIFEMVDDVTGRAVYSADLTARVPVKFREVLNR
ncbi:hypothetical protein K3722_07510 [Leisingera caerulea]|uniref:Uncharacterized protein n=1 Tax=Leisingera caerulea TaxID=506591 RepID=A0ABY5X065_LEICA|nr:hypothetical protein [Leisingera caerulea]UWQ59968.1 hypothetical protein K3722_07510 [Leisingera caerulea]